MGGKSTMGAAFSTSRDSVIYGLDLIRFASALLVMIFHLGYWVTLPGEFISRAVGGEVYFTAVSRIVSSGWVGVQIFFVISGFVIAYSVRAATPISYFNSRVLRIVPTVVLCTLITFLLCVITGFGPVAGLAILALRSIFFVPFGPWIDAVYWSLIIEISFYALVLGGLLVFKKEDNLRAIAYLLTVASSLFWLTLPWFMDEMTWNKIYHSWVAAIFLLRHGCFFAIGIMIWYGLSSGFSKADRILVAFASVACLVEIFHANVIHNAVAGSSYSFYIPACIWFSAIILIFFSVRYNALVRRYCFGKEHYVRTLGLATFPLYLLHSVAGGRVVFVLREVCSIEIALVISGLVSLGLAYLVVRFEPFVRRLLVFLILRIQGFHSR